MHIELIGCTSAGKSSLTRRILHVCRRQGIDLIPGDDFVLKQFRLNWVKGHLPRTLLVDLAALVACLATWRNNLEFYRFAAHLLFQLPIARLERLNLLRNVLKKIGIHEIIHFRGSDPHIVLVDEGVLQAAHNLFVHGSVQVKPEYLEVFSSLIPLPDVIVYLRQPESLLVARTMKRGHKRIPDRSLGKVVPFIRRAVTTFDKLVQNPALENKLMIVNGTQGLANSSTHHSNGQMSRAMEIIQEGMAVGSYKPLKTA